MDRLILQFGGTAWNDIVERQLELTTLNDVIAATSKRSVTSQSESSWEDPSSL